MLNGPAQAFSEADPGLPAQGVASAGNFRLRLADLPRAGGSVIGLEIGARQLTKLVEKLADRHPSSAGDVEDLARDSRRVHRQEIRLHGTIHVREVPRLLAVPEH